MTAILTGTQYLFQLAQTKALKSLKTNTMKKLIKELVQNQLVKSEQLAEDAVILFFTFTSCLALMAIAIVIELAL